MKKIYNLLYCDSVLTTNVVHYIVFVGQSVRDQKAAAQIANHAASNKHLYFHINDHDGAQFLEMVRESLKPTPKYGEEFRMSTMRTRAISVTRMASLIRNLPLPLLNSTAYEHHAV